MYRMSYIFKKYIKVVLTLLIFSFYLFWLKCRAVKLLTFYFWMIRTLLLLTFGKSQTNVYIYHLY